MTVAEPEMPASERRLVALARWDALIFLYYGIVWVGTAASLAKVIARGALGEVEGSAVLAAASWLSHHSLIFAAVFTPVALILVGATGVRSAYNTRKDIKDPPKTLHQVAQMMLKDPVIVGALVLLVFLPLISHEDLVVGLLPVKESQREHVRSVLTDVGSLGVSAVFCFIMLPTTVLRQWRMK
ncbi:unnamed protein product [Triticum turgidum subsp. durum]|uniref:Uncharacterized protein n=1 Tax=Triticum turgidum subsp. durum TaxID=4567 RepID=A0A9R1R3D1_TRITD|nr:unnamed protein product [Triticum turgidum subsp. durum]